MLNSYLDLKFEVIKRVDNSRYGNVDDIRLVNLGPIALFSIFKLTLGSGIHLEDISHAHIASSLYKQISSAKDSDDLSIGFNRDRKRRQNELFKSKKIKGNKHVRFMLKETFDFAEHQEKANFGLGNNLTPTRNQNNAVLQKAVAITDAKIKIDHFHLNVRQYTPSIQQQGNLSKQISSKTPTELRYIERSVFFN